MENLAINEFSNFENNINIQLDQYINYITSLYSINTCIYFLKKSKITDLCLDNSTFGYIFNLHCKNHNYIQNVRYNNFNNNVKDIVLKIVVLHDTNEEYDFSNSDDSSQTITYTVNDITKQTLTVKEFLRECIIHNYVYSKTNNSINTKLNPICPVIYNSTIMDYICAREFFKLMNYTTNNKYRSLFDYLRYKFNNKKYKLGLCFMERIYSEFSVHNYILYNNKKFINIKPSKNKKKKIILLDSLKNSDPLVKDSKSNVFLKKEQDNIEHITCINYNTLNFNKQKLINLSRYIIILLYNCGIIHNDAHLGNIITQNFNKKMIKLNENTARSLFLIDYGFASFHDEEPIDISTLTKQDLSKIYKFEFAKQSSAYWIYYNKYDNQLIEICDEDIAMIKKIHHLNNSINTNVSIICNNYENSNELFDYSDRFINNFDIIYKQGMFERCDDYVWLSNRLGISTFFKDHSLKSSYKKFINNIMNVF